MTNRLICSIVEDEIQDEHCISISVCKNTYISDGGGDGDDDDDDNDDDNNNNNNKEH